LVTVAGSVLSSPVGAGEGWGRDRSAVEILGVGADAAGGHESQRGALRAGADRLSEDGYLDGSVLLAALDGRSGPDRYDPATGDLFLDDKVHVDLCRPELHDGTWSVGNVRYCA
jgi:hypothetical protein